MPLDAVCVSALSRELESKLIGGKIDKIQQPESDMLILSLRSQGENLKLLLACGTGNARIHFTSGSFENPAEPPMFCMLLRKHLIGARVMEVSQPMQDRMIQLRLTGRDELGFDREKLLIVEMIGRSSNVILVDAEGRIIDCMRRMDFGGDALRRMLPGMIYRLPPQQNKHSVFSVTDSEIDEAVRSADKTKPADKWLMASFSGLSPLICRELSYRCGGDYGLLSDVLCAFCQTLSAGEAKPYMLMESGRPRDFSFMSISQYGSELTCYEEESFSKLLDVFYSQRDRTEQQRRRSRELSKTVRTLRDRQVRKLIGQREELKRTEGREDVRKKAELITANLYRIKKGDRVLECEDYYAPDCPTVTIALNELKTPQQNMAGLYKEYNKLKAAREHLSGFISQGEAQLDYLNSVLELIDRAESEKDIGDIRRELIETGYIRKKKSSKPARGKAQAPLRFVSDEGFEILAGRSNIQNDELTTKIARRTDYWLHTQKLHGSHVIIRCDGLQPGDETIRQAAVIAAYYSQAKDGGKTPVDYAMLRFVRKPSGALPGRVVYTDYSTVIVESDAALVQRLKK